VRIVRFGLLAMLLWRVSPETAAASEEADALHRAEKALQEGLERRDNPQEAKPYFQSAAREYESLGQLGNRNSSLLRNEGNANLLSGDLPRAIFAYRRGLRLAPADAILRANLQYARELVDYPSGDGFGRPPIDHWPHWLPRLPLSALVALTVVVYAASLASLTRWWMTRRGSLLVAGLIMVGLAGLPLGGVIHEGWQQRQEARHPLVVLAASRVPLRNGDGMAYPARYEGKTLGRGTEARLLFERGDWLHIELSGGETGWVRRTDVLVDGW
jgi:tetratricopeptide (TPR) repeat protein